MREQYDILYVEKNARTAMKFQRYLQRHSFPINLLHASSLGEAMHEMVNGQPDLLVIHRDAYDAKALKLLLASLKSRIPLLLISKKRGFKLKGSLNKLAFIDVIEEKNLKNKKLAGRISEALLKQASAHREYSRSDLAASQLKEPKSQGRSSAYVIYHPESGIQYYNTTAFGYIQSIGKKSFMEVLKKFCEVSGSKRMEFSRGAESYELINEGSSDLHNRSSIISIHKLDKGEQKIYKDTFNDLFNSDLFAMIIHNGESIFEINATAREQTDYQASELSGVKLSDLIRGDLNFAYSLETQSVPVTILSRSGEVLERTLISRPIRYGSEVCWISSFRIDEKIQDKTTENKELDIVDKLSRMIEENPTMLEDRSSNLDNLLKLASHDLKEPLRVIFNYSQLLQRKAGDLTDKEQSEEFISYLAFITDSASKIDQLIKDFKTYVNSQDQVTKKSTVALTPLLEELIMEMSDRLDAFHVSISSDKLPVIRGDMESIRQVLKHLIENAIKFRAMDKNPVIQIQASKKDNFHIISVKDNGKGIEKPYHDKIFEVMEKADHSTATGTGMGLSTCRVLIEQHGGKIWVDSIPGQGSTFYFSIPTT